MKNNNYLFRVLFTLLTAAFVGLILLNSSLDSQHSSQMSGGVLQFLQNLTASFGWETGLTEHIIRKTAHFLEYFAVGVLLFATIRSYSVQPGRHLFLGLFLGLIVPVCDEYLQTQIPGRSGEPVDILLDFAGVAVGTAVFFLVLWLHRRRHPLSGGGRLLPYRTPVIKP